MMKAANAISAKTKIKPTPVAAALTSPPVITAAIPEKYDGSVRYAPAPMIASGSHDSPSTVRNFPKVKPYAYAIVLPTGIFVIAAPREVRRCYARSGQVTIARTGRSALSRRDEHDPHHRRRPCGKRSGVA